MVAQHASSRPAVAVLRTARASLEELACTRLPRLHALGAELHREVAAADAAPLLAALESHAATARALRFERLIPPGLRAVVSRADEAAFRGEVQALVGATAVTWAALRGYLGASAGASARCDVLMSEFVMQARSLQRGVTHWDRPLAQLREQAPAGFDQPALQRLERMSQVLVQACESARLVRRGLHALEQQRASAHAALLRLAHGLGGGLLERLRPMVAATGVISRDDIEPAQAARQALQPLLAAAAAQLAELDAARVRLLALLAGIGGQLQPQAWSTTGSAPLAAEP